MNVLILSTNREKSPFAVAPIGAAHVVSALEDAGHTVAFLDLAFVRDMKKAIAGSIRRHRPEVIGVSIRNVDDCLYPNGKTYYQESKKIIDLVKVLSDAPLVIGGSGVSVMPEELAGYLNVSFAVVGEGEKPFVSLLKAFESSDGFSGIPGLMVRDGFRWIATPPDFSTDLNQLAPYAYKRIDYARYFRQGGFIGLQTKRGCAFRCVYCNYRTLEGNKIRYRAPQTCVDDMERIVRETGLRDFFFTDSVFNWPREHALAVCEEMIRRNMNVRWVAYCNPAGLDREMARCFKASGCAGVELGLDAVTEEMLENMRKGFGRSDIRTSFQALQEAEIPFAVFLLFGGPGDSYDNMVETQRILKSYGKPNAVFASLGIRIYRDAPIYEIARQEGQIRQEDSLLRPVYYLSSRMEEDIMAKLDRLARREAVWSTPSDWNSWVVGAVQKVLGRIRVIPNWKDIEAYGKHMRRKC